MKSENSEEGAQCELFHFHSIMKNAEKEMVSNRTDDNGYDDDENDKVTQKQSTETNQKYIRTHTHKKVHRERESERFF